VLLLYAPVRGVKYCDERVGLSVCLSVCEHISEIASPSFTKYSVHATHGRGSGLPGGVAICDAFPVLWMTSCFSTMCMSIALQRRRSVVRGLTPLLLGIGFILS